MKLELAMLGDQPLIAGLKTDVAEMERMVDSYLAFARGEGEEQSEPVDLGPILNELVTTARRTKPDVTLATEGDLDGALTEFDAAAEQAPDQTVRESAQIRAAYIAAETQDFAALRTRLQPLSSPIRASHISRRNSSRSKRGKRAICNSRVTRCKI